MRQGQGIALDFSSDRALRDMAKGWEGRVRYAAGQVRNDLGFRALLIRPDGVVAWADEDGPDRDELAQAATRWFGSPEN
ncbi:hypothetical protein [Lentzea sp. E54]|uniref:aromatic-ring hydroxylase C-terminal domain-containing protein n=1 Tax=Lentzea xerophila TaxID=3435883 RepID=UPI003DA242FC